MDNKTKNFLKEVVSDLEDIRANVVFLLDRMTISHALATEGKTKAIAVNRERYEKLRKDLDAL
jgi:hypothetical protein